jgi:hypothetical protein
MGNMIILYQIWGVDASKKCRDQKKNLGLWAGKKMVKWWVDFVLGGLKMARLY